MGSWVHVGLRWFPGPHLRARGAKSRGLRAGAATNWCIRATAYGALDRGYDLTLVADGHTTGSMPLDDGTTIEADHVVRELNLAMTWLSYPGRKNASATVDQLAFGDACQ